MGRGTHVTYSFTGAEQDDEVIATAILHLIKLNVTPPSITLTHSYVLGLDFRNDNRRRVYPYHARQTALGTSRLQGRILATTPAPRTTLTTGSWQGTQLKP